MLLPATPENLIAIRRAASLTQANAAALVGLGDAARWSDCERGVATMDAARWELFLIKTGHHPTLGRIVREVSA